jgi:uncharacterized DUF497 family protein
MSIEFEWDDAKASANDAKHGVSFEEASTVFGDPLAAIFFDETHSDEEDREIIVGHASTGRLLLVSYADREDRVRIISAREATPRERRNHERGSNEPSGR